MTFRWVEESLSRGVDAPQRVLVQLEVPKKGCLVDERLLHKLNRPIIIALAHTRLHGSAIVQAITASIELCSRWPTEFFTGRPGIATHQASYGASAAIVIQLFRTSRAGVADVDGEGAFIQASHRLALLAEHEICPEIQATAWVAQLVTGQRIQGLTVRVPLL